MSRASDFTALYERLIDLPIGGGAVTVPTHEREIGHRALAWRSADDSTLHPAWATLLGLRGMKLSFEELFELCGATMEEGIYFGEAGVEMRRDLKSGTTYQVAGRISDLVRRHGKTAGTFDILTFELDLTENDGTLAATATNSFIFVRGDVS